MAAVQRRVDGACITIKVTVAHCLFSGAIRSSRRRHRCPLGQDWQPEEIALADIHIAHCPSSTACSDRMPTRGAYGTRPILAPAVPTRSVASAEEGAPAMEMKAAAGRTGSQIERRLGASRMPGSPARSEGDKLTGNLEHKSETERGICLPGFETASLRVRHDVVVAGRDAAGGLRISRRAAWFATGPGGRREWELPGMSVRFRLASTVALRAHRANSIQSPSDMHGAPRNMQHRRRRVGDLAERAPALINLPFPDPSIPILDPLLKPLAPLITPIIDGQHPATKTTTPASHATTTSPPQAPTPNPTTAAPSPSSPSSTPSNGSDPSNGNGSGDGQGDQGNSGSGGSNGSGGGNSGSSNGGGSGGSPDAPSNGSSGAPAPNGPAASSPSAAVPGGATGTNAASPGQVGSSPSGVPGSDGQQASGSNASGSSAGSAPGADLTPVINANGAAFVSGTTSVPLPGQPGYDAHTTGISAANAATPTGADGTQGVGQASGSPGISQSGAGSSSTANNADPSRSSSAGGDGSHHGLSAGIIAAISVIVALLFLVLLVFCCRRRAVALRLRRRNRWFAAGSYNAAVSADDYRDGGSGTKSARSSFATNIDRGQMLTPAPPLDLMPPANDMSQVWPSNLNGSITVVTVPPATRTVESAPSPTIRAAPDRTSLSSLSSSGSGGGSRPPSQSSQYQHLTLPGAAATEGSAYGHDFPSPFSVRPFSPSETFSFPRPPQDDAHSRASGMMSGSVVSGSVMSAAFFTAEDHPISSPASSPEPRLGPEENPFLDFTEIAAAAGRPTTASSEGSAHFSPVEMIRRPFVPTMDDEMAVNPGENVRIIKRFDDGWAYAENTSTGMQGLIPIDCLRPIEEDLPAFLAKKRLSSYVPGPASAQERRATLMSQRTSVLSGTSVGKAM
ncbi:hypothetical protein PYCCODRAFT_1422105 [Trametes coccinea BRFM310]|uniref:SH3 domain-containing protein n=1 Tax=Trametes coccinea (strain BRFM310) TaxID=1353009 RepID=A0A1Y2J379_TRAC3|nr:hypothetical protein PYCCODRAFT_1422105 [Trametes coccinea BRFM310]